EPATAAAIARRAGLALMAVGDVLYHDAARRPLQDVLTAIRCKTQVARAGHALAAHAERHLKGPGEMARLFAGYGAALAETIRLCDRLAFSLDELRYEYPEESCGECATPQEELERLTWLGARSHYGEVLPETVRRQLLH